MKMSRLDQIKAVLYTLMMMGIAIEAGATKGYVSLETAFWVSVIVAGMTALQAKLSKGAEPVMPEDAPKQPKPLDPEVERIV